MATGLPLSEGQEVDLGGTSVPSELDVITIEVFKELSEGVGTMKPEEKDVR